MIFLNRWHGMIRGVLWSLCWPAKQERPAGGWPAEPPPTIKSVQYLCEEGRQRESSRERKKSSCQVVLIALLYPCMLNVRFTLVKHTVQWGRLISSLTWFDWSHEYWRLPATKAHVRGLTHSGGRNLTLGQTWPHSKVGTNISLTKWNEEDSNPKRIWNI
jgi:hypothetical protein